MNRVPHGTETGASSSASAATAAAPDAPHIRSRAARLALTVCATLAFTGFVALGTWQVKRLQWKLDLIARVEQRVHAPAVAAPGPERWPQVRAGSDEYRHVRLTGTWLYSLTTPVQAITELGSGFWLLTPLRSADGSVVLVNRGFVSTQVGERYRRNVYPQKTDPSSISTVTGLLRMSEPGGAFLHRNTPSSNRWYSRDVQAIAAARGLLLVAPYFVDADAAEGPANGNAEESVADQPVGGLTVISFHNSHLVYAFTWYALALMVAGGFLWAAREERKLLNGSSNGADTSTNGIDRESEDGKQR